MYIWQKIYQGMPASSTAFFFWPEVNSLMNIWFIIIASTQAFLLSPMNHYSIARNSFLAMKKPNPPLFVSRSSPFRQDSTFIWSNLAFISDENNDNDCSSVGSNTLLISPEDCNKRKEYFNMHVTEEELKIREELVREIEKELEREIMDGILVLVHRLSDLKAKQIAKGLKKMDLDAITKEFSAVNRCSSCKIIDGLF